jgi:PAS domain S-box-containing protein
MDQSVDRGDNDAIISSAVGSVHDNPVRHVIEALPAALVLVGPAGSIELVNWPAERLFAYGHDEMVNLPLEALIPGGLRNDVAKAGSTRQMDADRPLNGRRKDGSEFPLEIGLNPLFLHGRSLVLAGIIDLTARKLAEAENQRQRIELERSTADFDEFTHAVSHDLKAPLLALGHLAEWIAEDVEATASADTLENLKILKGRVRRLQSLFNGLLMYSRVGHGQKPTEDVDMDDLVADISAALAPPPGFSVVREGVLGHLRTPRMPIRQVLENLIGNAIKHHDRPEGRIEIGMRLADGTAELRVKDDGPGIEPRTHARIFVIFQTLIRRDEVEPRGTGLAIVKKHVEAHGGRIRVESAPPARGTSFVFTWHESAV